MDLKQHLIHRNYQKCEAKSQITVGDDYSIPEGKPDISSVLQKKAELLAEEVHTEKGKIRIRGKLKVWVLYLTERAKEPADSLFMEFPFDEILYMEGAENGDNLKIDWDIEELRIGIVHPGKLNVRALIGLNGMITGTKGHMVAENTAEAPNVYARTENFVMAEPVMERRENFRIRDEINLPANKPNVQNILWKDLQMRGLDIRMQEGRLGVKGEALLFVLYQPEGEESQVQWLEQTVPFHGTVDVTGLTPEMFGHLETEVSHQSIEIKPDYDGEMRMFQVEMILEIHMNVYEEQTCQVLMDVYSTEEKLNLQTEEIQYERLRMCNQTKCKVSGQERLGEDVKILQILGHQAGLQNKRCKMTEQGVLCEGMLEVQILYVTSSDSRPFDTMVVSVPYSQLVEIPEIEKDDSWKVSEMLEQTSITMPEGNVLELRGIISFQACVMQQCSRNNIVNITAEPYDLEEYKNCPGMRIHFVQPKETLWGIAKENRTTVEEMKKVNDLTAEEITPGQKLLILKTAAEPLQLL